MVLDLANQVCYQARRPDEWQSPCAWVDCATAGDATCRACAGPLLVSMQNKWNIRVGWPWHALTVSLPRCACNCFSLNSLSFKVTWFSFFPWFHCLKTFIWFYARLAEQNTILKGSTLIIISPCRDFYRILFVTCVKFPGIKDQVKVFFLKSFRLLAKVHDSGPGKQITSRREC